MGKEFDGLPDDIEVLRDMPRAAKMQLGKVRPGPGVRQATLEIVKKRPGRRPRAADERGEGGDGGGAEG